MFSSLKRKYLQSRWKRALFSLAALPALLFGSTLEGHVALFHAHGDEEEHVHVFPSHEFHTDLETFSNWHHAKHSEEDHHPEPQSDHSRKGLLLAIPSLPAGFQLPRNTVVESTCGILIFPARILPCALPFSEQQQDLGNLLHPRGRPSGLLGILRSSHAILI